jgi:hypothetical protein
MKSAILLEAGDIKLSRVVVNVIGAAATDRAFQRFAAQSPQNPTLTTPLQIWWSKGEKSYTFDI